MKIIKIVLMMALFFCLATTSFGGNPYESRAYVEERFVAVLIGQIGVDLEVLSDKTSLREDLGADSTDLAELVMELEEVFDIFISDAQWADVTTIESAVDLVFELRNPSGW